MRNDVDDDDDDGVDAGDLLPLPAHSAEALHTGRAQSLPARHHTLFLGNIFFSTLFLGTTC